MSLNRLKRIFISIKHRLSNITNIDRWLLRIYKAKPVEKGELSEIHERLSMLSFRRGVPVPSMYVTELPLPGSFIIGKNKHHTSVVIPKRLVNLMTIDQLEAVLAYNIVQINELTGKRTMVALITGILTKASSAVRWGAVFTGFGDYDDPAPKLFGLFVMGLVAPPAATMIHNVSKKDHDSEASALCRSPEKLITAIECLEANNVKAYHSLGYLSLVDPIQENCFEQLFKTHQSKEIRIMVLRGLNS